ncbi:MAG TPA: hypothetical protein VF314_14350 [Actinomycetes bacterium]
MTEQPPPPDREEPHQPAVPVEPVVPGEPEPATRPFPVDPQTPAEPPNPAEPGQGSVHADDTDDGTGGTDDGTGADDDEPADSDPAGEHDTGDPRVDAALGRLDELEGSPPPEHVAVYEDVHRTLQEVLAEASGRPDGGGGARP